MVKVGIEPPFKNVFTSNYHSNLEMIQAHA